MSEQGSMTQEDRDHLKLLATFHYVVAGFLFLGALLPVFHLVFGLGMVAGWFEDGEAPVRLFGLLFVIAALAAMAFLAGLGVAMVVAGRALADHRRWTFCLVIAAIACTMAPFGTVLGIFTILVLMRPAVKATFEASAAEPAQEAST